MTKKKKIDYLANEANDQTPVISNIGRGPKGSGVTVTDVETDEVAGVFSFKIREDLFGEVLVDSGNLHPGILGVKSETPSSFAITVTKDGVETILDRVDVPRGEKGSSVAIARTVIEWPFPYKTQTNTGVSPSEWEDRKSTRLNSSHL